MEEASEFVIFLMDNLFHGSYREERDLPQIQQLLKTLPFESTKITFPNSKDPSKPIVVTEPRIAFQPLYDITYSKARTDGCIWVPFEETTETAMKKLKKNDYAEQTASQEALRDKQKASQ